MVGKITRFSRTSNSSLIDIQSFALHYAVEQNSNILYYYFEFSQLIETNGLLHISKHKYRSDWIKSIHAENNWNSFFVTVVVTIRRNLKYGCLVTAKLLRTTFRTLDFVKV